MGDWSSVGFDPGTFTDSGWDSVGKGIFGGSGAAPDYSGGTDYWGKGAIDTSAAGGTKGLYGGGSENGWGGIFSSLFDKAKNAQFSQNDPYGKGSTGFGGGGGWNGASSIDLGGGNTIVTTGGGSPFSVAGMPAKQTHIGLGPLSFTI